MKTDDFLYRLLEVLNLLRFCVESDEVSSNLLRIYDDDKVELHYSHRLSSITVDSAVSSSSASAYIVGQNISELLVGLQSSENIDTNYTVHKEMLLNIYSLSISPNYDYGEREQTLTELSPICAIDLQKILPQRSEREDTGTLSFAVGMLTSFLLLVQFDENRKNTTIDVVRIGLTFR